MIDPSCRICGPRSPCVHGEQSPTDEERELACVKDAIRVLVAENARLNAEVEKLKANRPPATDWQTRAETAEVNARIYRDRIAEAARNLSEERDQWKRRVDEAIGDFSAATAAKVCREIEAKNLRHDLKDLATVAAGRVYAGHNDTCGAVLSMTPYPCSCGHDLLDAAVAKHLEVKR